MSTLEIPGAINFRDVGGLPAGDSRTRAGVLYRSGNLASLSDEGVTAFGALGIRRVIDLRADDEVAHAPSRVGKLAPITQREPLFLGSVASFFEQDVSLREMYRQLLIASSARIVDVVRGVLVDQPVLVHCTVGKDRTGVTVAVALSAAGVDRDAVIADYARTEALLPSWRNREVIARIRLFHPEAQNIEELATRSPAEVMREILAELDSEYGSVGDYLRAQGMDDEEILELRRVLVT